MENKNNFSDFLSSKKAIIIAAILFVTGLLFIYLQGVLEDGQYRKNTNVQSDASLYIEQCESRLESIANSICGGKSNAMVTLDCSYESVFANNATVDETTDNGTDIVRNSKKELVLLNTAQSGDQPVEIKRIMPKIKGVVIVCDGADNKVIKDKITNAAMCAFNISQDRICVVQSN